MKHIKHDYSTIEMQHKRKLAPNGCNFILEEIKIELKKIKSTRSAVILKIKPMCIILKSK